MRKAYHALCVVLCLFVVSNAQDKGQLKWKIESSAQYWAGVTFDYYSTKGLREKSPLIRADDGRIDGKKYFAINSGVFAATFLLDKKHPRVANWTRRILGWVHIGAGVRNLAIK